MDSLIEIVEFVLFVWKNTNCLKLTHWWFTVHNIRTVQRKKSHYFTHKFAHALADILEFIFISFSTVDVSFSKIFAANEIAARCKRFIGNSIDDAAKFSRSVNSKSHFVSISYLDRFSFDILFKKCMLRARLNPNWYSEKRRDPLPFLRTSGKKEALTRSIYHWPSHCCRI